MKDEDFYWNKNYDNRLKFAYKAEKKLFNSLNEAVPLSKKYLEATINVSVYGRSQVGKTSLILKLIGVNDNEIFNVSKSLRGKRKKGESATLFPTIYSISENDNYYITINYDDKSSSENEKKTEEDVELLFEEIRENAFNSEKRGIDSINIKIPEKYINKTKEGKVKLNIFDLPGVDSSDKKEHKIVGLINEKYIPISNLVLVVENATQVNSLKKINIPGIVQVEDMQEKFRIILTRSISSESIKKEIRSKNFSLNKYMDLFCKTSSLKNINRNYIFPLDFGESYNQLEDEIIEKTKKILDSIYLFLITQINDSKNEYNSFASNLSVYKLIERKKEAVILEYEKKIGEMESRLARHRQTENNHQELGMKWRSEKEKEINEMKEMITEFDLIKELNSELNEREICDRISFNENIIMQIESNIKSINNIFNKYKNKTEKLKKINSEYKEKFCENSYTYFQSKKDFWDVIKDPFKIKEKKKNKFIKNIYEMINEYNNGNSTLTRKTKEAIIQDRNHEIEKCDKKIVAIENESRKKVKCIDLIKSEIEEINKNKDIYVKEKDQDVEKSKLFMDILSEEYAKEYENIVSEINRTGVNNIDTIEYLYIISNEMSMMEGYFDGIKR